MKEQTIPFTPKQPTFYVDFLSSLQGGFANVRCYNTDKQSGNLHPVLCSVEKRNDSHTYLWLSMKCDASDGRGALFSSKKQATVFTKRQAESFTEPKKIWLIV